MSTLNAWKLGIKLSH
ncbi:hypothetical protein CGLO_14689 [Colletotrichum gloeosporioides Cg-14]|uniref:Uncharacterized protein n=1 Tax=Colletotrichum gloeosporioides (strain Cg-14) TaxID=1237896 RepID=T0K0H2_COLGC|nr:hypothetical protein CGLO_14689 [Colletotrichum gloeosporioides Cg-14]